MATQPQGFTQRQTMLGRSYEIFHYRSSALREVGLHHHDFYEVYLFLSGNVRYNIESRSYDLVPGDIMLLGPMELHQLQVQEDDAPYERMVLWLDKHFLEGLSTAQTGLTRCFDTSASTHSNLLRLPPAQRAQVQTLLEQLDAESHMGAAVYGSDVAASACLLQLLVLLNRLAVAQPRPTAHDEQSLVPQVLRYINTHFNDELSLDVLASKFFVSKYHLSHEFGRRVGTSVYRYIIQKRLVNAKQMLADGMAPTDVYKHCGFGDYANFYRAFKAEYHISPKQYTGSAQAL